MKLDILNVFVHVKMILQEKTVQIYRSKSVLTKNM